MEDSIALDTAKTAINACTTVEKLATAKYAIEAIPDVDLSALSDAVLELEILIASLKDR